MRLRFLLVLALLPLGGLPRLAAAEACGVGAASGARRGAELVAADGVPGEVLRAGEGVRLLVADERSRSRRALWPLAPAGSAGDPAPLAVRRAPAAGRGRCAFGPSGGEPPYYATAPPASSSR